MYVRIFLDQLLICEQERGCFSASIRLLCFFVFLIYTYIYFESEDDPRVVCCKMQKETASRHTIYSNAI